MSNDAHIEAPPARDPRFRPAAATAVVAAALMVIVGALLIHNFLQIHGADLRDSDQLADLKASLFARPGDEKLKQQIRTLDLALRQEYFARRRFAAVGTWLLLADLAVLALALKFAVGLWRPPAAPAMRPYDPDRQIRAAGRARWALAAAGAAVICAAAGVALLHRPVPAGKVQMAATAPSPADESGKHWPCFRGPAGAGVSAHANVPTSWDGRSGKGILWKSPVPLPGKNSPILWGDRVFLTGADNEQRELYCFDARTGALLWRRDVKTDGSPVAVPEGIDDTGLAAPTAATDGQRVYAIFANGDLGCFDFAGKEVWAKSLGIPENIYGYASSLATWRNLLLIQFDQDEPDAGKSELIALDGATGKPVWVSPRPVGNSWTSPAVIDTGKGQQIITCSLPWVIAYDPAKGTEIWRVDCLFGDVAPSPVYGAGMVFAVNTGAVLAAIRTDGRGNVTKTHVVWQVEEGLPDICSPLTDGRRVYLLTTDGLLTCYAAADGKKLYEQDLEATFNASPSLIGDRVLLLSNEGVAFFIAAADTYKLLGKAELGEDCCACPAFADGRIFLRGNKHLYCIGGKTVSPQSTQSTQGALRR